MPAQPVFTEQDYAELRRWNRRLYWTPRVRMRTSIGRTMAHATVLGLEGLLAPAVKRMGVPIETRSVIALGKRLTLRILRPEGKARGVHLDIHGGGWCAGNARMDDLPNARLVRDCGAAVVSVEYSLAPRTPIRTIIAQCDAAAVWLHENARREFGTNKITIGGESAGAHLAACVLLKRRDVFRGALLYYGVYDLAGSRGLRSATKRTLVFHAPTLLPSLRKLTPKMTDEDRRAPDLSPLFADLAGLPPALFIVGTSDVLQEENEALRKSWQAANGNADILLVPFAPHAFNRLPIAIAGKTHDFAHAWLSERFSAQNQ